MVSQTCAVDIVPNADSSCTQLVVEVLRYMYLHLLPHFHPYCSEGGLKVTRWSELMQVSTLKSMHNSCLPKNTALKATVHPSPSQTQTGVSITWSQVRPVITLINSWNTRKLTQVFYPTVGQMCIHMDSMVCWDCIDPDILLIRKEMELLAEEWWESMRAMC